MRKLFLSLGVVLAALIAAPAAEAHHLDQDTSTIVCVLTNNAPAVQVSAHYVDFSYWDQPVYRLTKIDGVISPEGSGEIPRWNGPDYYDRFSLSAAPGQHDVNYQASWNNGDNGGYLSRRVLCPTPVPPQPTPTPTPTPQPPVTIYYDCAGHQLPAGSPPATCPPPILSKPPCACHPKPRFHCPVIHLIRPNPSTQAGRHGVHDFGGRCSRGKIVSTTLYVTATGPRGGDAQHGRGIVGHRTVRLHARGSVIHGVWLYDLSVWRHRLAWGTYRLKFVFRVRRGGHVFVCVRRAHFFNHDPRGLPS